MVIIWREREHEEQYVIALSNPGTVEALRDCGLLKYLKLSNLRQQMNLLRFLVQSWDPINQNFHIRGKEIPCTIDDIYFLTGLSRRGAPISLIGLAHGGRPVKYYVQQFCRPGSQPSKDWKILIKDVSDLPLRTILFTISKLVGSSVLHLATKSYMQYALECLQPKIFNWCGAVLSSVKEQLTNVKEGKLINFGYGSIMISFALERIPLLQPQLISLGLSGPRYPQLQRWTDLWLCMVPTLRSSLPLHSLNGSIVRR